MITLKCRFCHKEFKSIILDKGPAALNVTQIATTHLAERHPEKLKEYLILLQSIAQTYLPAALLYDKMLEIPTENVYMTEEVIKGKQFIKSVLFPETIILPNSESSEVLH